MTRQQAAGRLGVAGGALGVVAGIVQATAGTHFPDWTGDKDNPVGLGLLTVLLRLIAVGAAVARNDLSPPQRTFVAAGVLVPAVLCFSTVGRLWYLPGILLLAAAAAAVAVAVRTQEMGTFVPATHRQGLVSLLGAFELLMAVSAGPTATIAVGVLGGIALMAAPWLTGRAAGARIPAMLLGTLPFAALTWWSLIGPLLAVVALALGLPLVRRTGTAPDRMAACAR